MENALPQFIEWIYSKHFKWEEPVTVRSLKAIITTIKSASRKRKKEKEKRLKNETLLDDDNNEAENPAKPLSLASKLKQLNEKPKVKVR